MLPFNFSIEWPWPLFIFLYTDQHHRYLSILNSSLCAPNRTYQLSIWYSEEIIKKSEFHKILLQMLWWWERWKQRLPWQVFTVSTPGFHFSFWVFDPKLYHKNTLKFAFIMNSRAVGFYSPATLWISATICTLLHSFTNLVAINHVHA